MRLEQVKKLQKQTVINNLKVKYIAEGKGEALLLIHGIPVWSYLWKDCIEALSKKYLVIIPDLVGYGYSDKRDCFDRSIKVQSEILHKLLIELKVEKLYLVGHDIGGAVAQRFLVDYEAMVKKAILMDSVLYDSWPADPMVKLGNPKQHYKTKNDELAKKFIKLLPNGFNNKKRATKELFEEWMEPYSDEEGKLSLIRNASALNTNHTMEIINDLKNIKVPITLVWGEKDEFQPIRTAEKFVKAYNGVQLITVSGANHFLPLEEPERVIEIIESVFE
jgi:pimeloyl-ACP methyl ester carboxylesterase